MHHPNKSTSVYFHIYHLIASLKVHGSHSLYGKKLLLCLQDQAFVPPTKIYTKKELVMIEKPIANFLTSFYISEIKLVSEITRVCLLWTNYCDSTSCEVFKCNRQN